MLVDSWEKLEEVTALIKRSLPINLQVELNNAWWPGRNTQPLPFDPRRNSTALPTSLPALAEVRVSLLIDETLGWVMPVQFSIGPLLTAAEIIEKVANTCVFLESWSHTHSPEARAHLRLKHLRSARPTPAEPLIQ